MQSEKSLPEEFGCENMYQLYEKLEGCKRKEHYFPLNSKISLEAGKMKNEYIENKSKLGSMYGSGFIQPVISYMPTKVERKVVEQYPDAFLFSIEREQRQVRSKTVRQIMHDDYMKKYGHCMP